MFYSSFFAIGKLKKFYINVSGKSGEITFFDAVKELEGKPDTKRANIPNAYYHLLQTNKTRFELDTTVCVEDTKGSAGRSNAKYVENWLKDKHLKILKGLQILMMNLLMA